MPDQCPFGPALGSVAKRIKQRATQALQPGQQLEQTHGPRAELALFRAAIRAATGQERRREVEGHAKPSGELGVQGGGKLGVNVKPRHFVFILIGQHLGIVLRHRAQNFIGSRRNAKHPKPHPVQQRKVARGQFGVLKLRQMGGPMINQPLQPHCGLRLRQGNHGRIMRHHPPPVECIGIGPHGNPVQCNCLNNRRTPDRDQALLPGIAQHDQIGGDLVARHGQRRRAEIVEMRDRPDGTGHHALNRRLLKIKVALAHEIGYRGNAGVQDGMGHRRITQRNRLFRPTHHAVRRQQQIRRAIGNARRSRRRSGGRQANMAHHRPALLRQPCHVQDQRCQALQMRRHAQNRADGQNAAAANPGHGDVPRALQRRQHRFGQERQVGQGGGMLDQPGPAQRDKGRAEAFDAREILVAGRLVDRPLAAKRGLQGLDGDAVRLLGTIAAALANRRIDEHPLVRVNRQPCLATAAQFGGTGLFEHDHRGARQVAQDQHHRVDMVAVPHLNPRSKVGGAVKIGPVRQQVNRTDPFVKQLMRDLRRGQVAVYRLTAGHRHRVIVQHLVGEVRPCRDGLADRQNAGVEIGAIAQVDKAMRLRGIAADRRPRHTLGPHMGEGLGRPVHPLRHEMTADPGHRL